MITAAVVIGWLFIGTIGSIIGVHKLKAACPGKLSCAEYALAIFGILSGPINLFAVWMID